MATTEMIIPLLRTTLAVTMQPLDLELQLVDNITYAVMYSGFSKSSSDKAFEAKELAKEIKNHYHSIRTSEIRVAFNNGLRLEYGEFKGLSVLTYVFWIKSYLNSTERRLALKNEHLALIESPKELTKQQLKMIEDDNLMVTRKHFERTGEILNKGNCVFRSLWKRGEIRFDEIQKQKYLDEARMIVNAELLNARKKAKDELKRGEVVKIESELMEIEDEKNTSVELVAGDLAVRDYFKKTI